ncbi:MAG: hypothetical protein ACRDNF_17750 [Streptosporangiaceae bacterium]
MSAMREELHHLVDELPEAKVGPVLDLVRDQVGDKDSGKRRRLSFAGMLHAGPDLAARSEEILRAGPQAVQRQARERRCSCECSSDDADKGIRAPNRQRRTK